MEQNFATTAEQRINEIRHAGVRLALKWLDSGHANRSALALETLLGSVLHQARVAGVAGVRF